MTFDPELDIHWDEDKKEFSYGVGVFGPSPEHRRLQAIRASLFDPNCEGPDPVYSIVMDVGLVQHQDQLRSRMLLFGIVEYASGRLGQEPVRSQGHVHAVSSHSGWSAPELFEIWEGRAIIYAQQYADDNPGICVAVEANPGDHVVVPPGWAHCVINADPSSRMIFAACCDREYGFAYGQVRDRGGLAWFPFVDNQGVVSWCPNPRYLSSKLSLHQARSYPELGLGDLQSIYKRFTEDPDAFLWISTPSKYEAVWPSFVP
jgi:glucose-6-phosphate isomerase